MDETQRATVTVLLWVTSVLLAKVQTLDVCASCHTNATCDDKPDGSGKVCNCQYGFVGDGRTFCQDKDECQIGSFKICGPFTYCHNTYGSFYCTCMPGYRPSSNMDVFIPNDGTHCQDIDECRISGLCGVGGLCKNLAGSFECSCQLGYKVHNGPEPFNPRTHKSFCKVVDCGRPPAAKNMVLLSAPRTTYGNAAVFACGEGFVWRSGDNNSVCGTNGSWRGLTAVCEEISCGDPPALPHTGLMWNGSSSPGSTVTYFCKTGFYHNPGNQTSSCTNEGYWTRADILCREVDCGAPPPIPHSVMLWANISTVGSQVVYQCDSGYHRAGGGNVSVCAVSGEWEGASLLCQEISCPRPDFKAQTKMLWDGSSHVGSVVYYQCEHGLYTRGLKNYSVCGEDGLWKDAEIWCEAECGPAPSLDNSEVVWHNRSAVIHRCRDGFHSWRGSNVSVCGSSGEWDKASIKCIERKPPINHLCVTSDKCVHWKAEKYEEDTEVYKVIYVGTRDYQKSFQDKRRKFVRSENDQLKLCLNLLPVTNYSISVTAVSTRFTTTIQTNTSLTVPPTPVVYYREFETPAPTLKLRRSRNTLDPLTLYQVFVLSVEGVTKFNCSCPAGLHSWNRNKPLSEYITATIQVRHVGTEINFTIGDGLYYDGFFNAQLKLGRSYYIILRAVSQWKTEMKSTCVLWAKVKGTSHILKVSAVCAASVVVILFIILGGFHLIRFFRSS